MSTVTKEWLQQTIAEYEANRDELPFGLDTNSAIELQAFKLALASLEAEPVSVFKIDHESSLIKHVKRVVSETNAPPVPVSVPDALPENDDEEGNDIDYMEPSEIYALGRTAGWNACRAAMLQGAEPVTTDYKLPPHIYRELVNRLRDTAVKYQGCQQLREQLSRTLQEVIQPAAPQQDTSRELLVSVEGDSCGKHPDTQLINHPHRQTASIPPHPVKYCPKCEPGVLPLKAFRIPDEWIFGAHTNCLTISCSVKSDKKITFVNSSFVNCSEPEGDIQFINCTLPAEWEGKVNAIDCVFKAAPQQEVE